MPKTRFSWRAINVVVSILLFAHGKNTCDCVSEKEWVRERERDTCMRFSGNIERNVVIKDLSWMCWWEEKLDEKRFFSLFYLFLFSRRRLSSCERGNLSTFSWNWVIQLKELKLRAFERFRLIVDRNLKVEG